MNARVAAATIAVTVCAGLVHCSLTTSPSDYVTKRSVSDAGDPSTVKRVVVAGGVRDRLAGFEPVEVSTSDVWSAPIDGNGAVGAWSVGPSLPFISNNRSTLVRDNVLYVVGEPRADEPSGRINATIPVQWIPLSPEGPRGAWQAAFPEVQRHAASNRYFTDMSSVLLPAGLLLMGGWAAIPVGDAGAAANTRLPDTVFERLDPASKTFAAPQIASPLTAARSHSVAIAYKSFIYVVGGAPTGTTASDAVDVARFREDAPNEPLTPFAATTKLADPEAPPGTPYRVTTVALCTGEGTLYVIGGALGVPTAAPSDLVLMARIDEAQWPAFRVDPADEASRPTQLARMLRPRRAALCARRARFDRAHERGDLRAHSDRWPLGRVGYEHPRAAACAPLAAGRRDVLTHRVCHEGRCAPIPPRPP